MGDFVGDLDPRDQGGGDLTLPGAHALWAVHVHWPKLNLTEVSCPHGESQASSALVVAAATALEVASGSASIVRQFHSMISST